IGSDHVNMVVEGAFALWRVGIEQTALPAGRHGHTYRIGHALAQRAGRHFDSVRVTVLGVSGRHRTPGTQRLDVVQADVVAGEVQLNILGQARMAARQDEPVSADPGGISRIMAHKALIDHVCRRCQTHGGARMPVTDVLYRVGCQHSHRVDGTAVDVGPFKTVFAHVLAPDLSMPSSVYAQFCLCLARVTRSGAPFAPQSEPTRTGRERYPAAIVRWSGRGPIT